MDLVALNLQRGRDHGTGNFINNNKKTSVRIQLSVNLGLPGYNSYRSLCGLPHADKFRDLLDVIPVEVRHPRNLRDDLNLICKLVYRLLSVSSCCTRLWTISICSSGPSLSGRQKTLYWAQRSSASWPTSF